MGPCCNTDPHMQVRVRIVVDGTTAAGAIVSTNNNRQGRIFALNVEGEYSPGSTAPLTFDLQLLQRLGTVATLLFDVDVSALPGLFKVVEIAQ